jgi:hypothetical protein
MTEDQLVHEVALAWNTLDPEVIIARLAADAVYESQNVREPLRGREAIADYLRGKMATVRNHPHYAVRAELGRCASFTGQDIAVLSAPEGRPCVLIEQGASTDPEALVLLDVANGEIRRVDICTVAPAPSTAERTGIYPGLPAARGGRPEPVPRRLWHFKTPDLGQRVVETLYQWSKIDAEWSVWHPRGFTWWAGPLAQHVWADPPVEIDGKQLYRVHARTDLLTGLDAADLQAAAEWAAFSSLSGWVRPADDLSRIHLATAVSVHVEVEDFLTRLMALAAALQVAEAHRTAPYLERVPGWSAAVSAHPSSGPRQEPDDMLNVIGQVVVPKGQEPSRWTGAEMAGAVELLQDGPCILATGDTTGVAGEYPFPGPVGTSLLRLQTEVPHPRLGNGCLCTLRLPYALQEPAATAAIALQLNGMELDRHLYFIGSWCLSDSGLSYVSFLPNAAHRPGALTNILLSLVSRVRWVTEEVFQYSLEEHFREAFDRKLRELEDLRARSEGR